MPPGRAHSSSIRLPRSPGSSRPLIAIVVLRETVRGLDCSPHVPCGVVVSTMCAPRLFATSGPAVVSDLAPIAASMLPGNKPAAG